MDIQTWAQAATVVATVLAVLGLLSRKLDRTDAALGARIERTEAALGTRIDKTEAALGARIDKSEAALVTTRDELLTRIDRSEGTLATTRDELTTRIEQTNATLATTRDELITRIEQVRREAHEGHAQTRAEFKADLAELRADFRFLSERMISFLAHPPEPRPRAPEE